MQRFSVSSLVVLFLAALPYCQQVSSVAYTATYNNIGIEVTFSGALPSGSAVDVAINNAQASAAWRNSHPLSLVSSNRFAGSVFSLAPGSLYIIRLHSSLFSQDRTDTVSTRVDSFPQPSGTVYHVAKSGRDNNTGTSASSAFATLTHALSVASPGSTILLHAGRYYEAVDIPRSGTATAPILVRSAPGEAAILDGRDTSFAPSWSVYNASANIYRTACAVQPLLAYYNGGHLFAHPTLSDLVANTWSMSAGFFADGAWLYVRFPHGGPPLASDTVQIPRLTTAITCTGRQFVQIKGLEICYYGLDQYSRAIYFDGSSFNLIDSCFLHHSCVGVALKRACTFNTVQRCAFNESPIDSWNWSAVKEGNDYYEAGGVVVYGSSSANVGNVIRNNTFSHMFDGSHLYSDDTSGPTTNMDFYGNVIQFANDDCIETDGAGSNCRIYNNTFISFLTGVSVAPATGGPTYIFRNLFRAWETHSGYVGYPIKFNVSSSFTTDWIYLYHNTCFTAVAGQPGFLFKEYSNWHNVVSRNNIYAGTVNALESWPSPNPVDFDYDGLYTTASGKLINWAGANYTTLAAFSTATGQEAHGIAGYPGFVDTGAGDFHLPATSPLVDKGIAIPGINDGFGGSGPDIGCFERGVNAVTTPAASTMTNGNSIEILPGTPKGEIRVRLRQSGSSQNAVTISVFDLCGTLVYRTETTGNTVLLARRSGCFCPGAYVVEARFKSEIGRKEFVVLR